MACRGVVGRIEGVTIRPAGGGGRTRDDGRRLLTAEREALERVTRIELALSAWEADVLPLNYTRERPPDYLAAALRRYGPLVIAASRPGSPWPLIAVAACSSFVALRSAAVRTIRRRRSPGAGIRPVQGPG